MNDDPTSFDARTAVPLLANAGGSPHHAYRDASGNICLVCLGRSPSGGVAVNEGALDWLRQQSGRAFVRFVNSVSRFELTVELARLPHKPMRDGERGRYAFFDPTDFGAAPPFPKPIAEEGPV